MIEVAHEFAVEAQCPMDELVKDIYDVTVRVRRVVAVEDIVAAAKALPKRPMFQEELTEVLAEKLDAEVTTRGVHSGVATTCRSGHLK